MADLDGAGTINKSEFRQMCISVGCEISLFSTAVQLSIRSVTPLVAG